MKVLFEKVVFCQWLLFCFVNEILSSEFSLHTLYIPPLTVVEYLKLPTSVVILKNVLHTCSQPLMLVWREPSHLTGVALTVKSPSWVTIASRTVVPMTYILAPSIQERLKVEQVQLNPFGRITRFKLFFNAYEADTWCTCNFSEAWPVWNTTGCIQHTWYCTEYSGSLYSSLA